MGNVVVLSSIQFIFRFLPLFLVVYYLTPARYRNGVLYIGSILFYACGDLKYLILLLALTVLNYYAGNALFHSGKDAAYEHTNDERGTLRLIVAGDVLVLAVCKILALMANNAALPLGISFYIFKMISYQADLYRGRMMRKPKFSQTAAYFLMFPQLTQGPIMRYEDGFVGRKNRREITMAHFEDGLVYVVLGLAMKVVLADRIGILWNELHKIGYDSISTPLARMGAYGYTFQLYNDFWGNSLIAASVPIKLGFDFIENFAHPYGADSIGEFYRRWHATLGSWFRDYIYFPLGGSRQGKAATIRNLMIVWLITGIWHGGTMNFVIWGVVLGLIIVVEKFLLVTPSFKKVIGRFNVLILIPLTWVIFAISNLQELGVYFGRLFPFFGIGQTADAGDALRYLKLYWPLFAAGTLFCIPAVFKFIVNHRRNHFMVLGLTILFWYTVYYMVTSAGNSFLYFSF